MEPLWKGYGFSFKNYRPNKKGKSKKWIMILLLLDLQDNGKELSKRYILQMIDEKGYNNPNINKRGWNSNVFTALANEGYIHYNNKTRKWSITKVGKEFLKNLIEREITRLNEKLHK